MAIAFLTAEWRDLLILNYEVDPGLLQPFVPTGTEVDRWRNRAFLSLVGFRFLKTKVFGIPFPFHRNFEEVNLRFYVRRTEETETSRGVVFIREIVPRWAIATVARIFYNENYVSLPTSHRLHSDDATTRSIEYAWKSRNGWGRISARVDGPPALPEIGSQQQFIAEHYWGYAAQPGGGCVEYRVDHPSWRVWSTESATFQGNVEDLYGPAFAAVISQKPASAFLAEGSEVTVHRGRRL
jgi:hypothetical protein